MQLLPLLASAGENGSVTLMIGQAILSVILLVVAAALVFLELLLVSGGLIGVVAIITGIAAIWVAFLAHPILGWIILVCTPTALFAALRFGLRRFAQSPLVRGSELSGGAGIGGHLQELGIQVGEEGTLETHARPTGRARFANGSVDVIVRGPPADHGTRVRIVSINGPSITVVAAEDQPASSAEDPDQG